MFPQPAGLRPFIPTDLGQPLAWYYVSRSYCFSDTGFTTPCNNGDRILGWRDRSGNGNHVTQPTSAQAPTFQIAGWNGIKPAASFAASGPNYVFTTDASLPILNRMQGTSLPYTVFVTFKPGGAATQALVGWHNLGNSKISCINSSNTLFPGTIIGVIASVRTDDSASSVFAEGQTSLDATSGNQRVGYVSTGTRIAGYLCLTTEFDSAQVVGALTPSIFSIGVDQNTIGKYDGTLTEIIIWDRAISRKDFHSLRAYSQREFGD